MHLFDRITINIVSRHSPSWFHSNYHRLQYETESLRHYQSFRNLHVYRDHCTDDHHHIWFDQIIQHPRHQIWTEVRRTEDPTSTNLSILISTIFSLTKLPIWGKAWRIVSRSVWIPFAIFNSFRTIERHQILVCFLFDWSSSNFSYLVQFSVFEWHESKLDWSESYLYCSLYRSQYRLLRK